MPTYANRYRKKGRNIRPNLWLFPVCRCIFVFNQWKQLLNCDGNNVYSSCENVPSGEEEQPGRREAARGTARTPLMISAPASGPPAPGHLAPAPRPPHSRGGGSPFWWWPWARSPAPCAQSPAHPGTPLWFLSLYLAWRESVIVNDSYEQCDGSRSTRIRMHFVSWIQFPFIFYSGSVSRNRFTRSFKKC